MISQNIIAKIHGDKIKSLGKNLILIIFIVLAFFITKWSLEGPYFKNDSSIITIPLESLYGNIQRSGQSPLWAPELAGGYPLLAIGQLGFWYPPHMILRQFFPAVITLNISLLLHTILAALGTFFFLKHNKVENGAAAGASILLTLSPVFVARYEMLNLILPFTWLPIILLLIQLSVEKPRLNFFIFLTIANFMCVLVGHPQMTLYVLIAELIFIICLFIYNWRWLPKIVLSGLFILVAIGLSAFSLVPITENLPNTDRANGSTDNPYEFQLTPASLLGIFVSHPFGHNETYVGPRNETELTAYIGLGALIFAFIGLFTAQKKYSIILYTSIALIITGLAFGMGELSPLYKWIVGKGWTYFSIPGRFYLFVHIGLVLLSAAGIDHCIAWLKKHQTHYIQIFQCVLIATAIIPAILSSYTWTKNISWKHSFRPSILQYIENTKMERIASIPIENLIDTSPDNDFGIHAWKPITSYTVFRQSFQSPYSQFNGIAVKLSVPTVGTGKVSLKLSTEQGEIVRKSSVFANKLVADDWSIFSFQPVKNSLNNKYYFELTSDMQKKEAPLIYIHTNPQEQYDPTGELSNCTNKICVPVTIKKTTDAAFKLVTEKASSVVGFESLAGHVAPAYQFGSTFWIGALPILDVKNFFIPFEKGSVGNGDLWPLNRFSTKYLTGIFPPYRLIENNNLKLENSVLLSDQYIRLYRNEAAFPRLEYIQNVKAMTGSATQLDYLKNLAPNNRDIVVADTEKDLSFDIDEAKASFTKDARTRIEIKTENSSDGFLVLRDVYLNGWQATIDGKPTGIYRTDSIFRGVLVPAGNHIVSFQYKPDWIRTAIMIDSLSTLAFVGLIFFTSRYNRKPKKHTKTA